MPEVKPVAPGEIVYSAGGSVTVGAPVAKVEPKKKEN